MVTGVAARDRYSTNVETLGTNVDIRAFQTPIADMLCTFATRIASVSGAQAIGIACLALLDLLQSIKQDIHCEYTPDG